jgi:hypothetical protein
MNINPHKLTTLKPEFLYAEDKAGVFNCTECGTNRLNGRAGALPAELGTAL